jgi:hypothetical protein
VNLGKMFSSRLKEFLIAGPLPREEWSDAADEAERRRQIVSDIRVEADSLHDRWLQYQEEELALQDDLLGVLSDVKSMAAAANISGFNGKLKLYGQLSTKIKFLTLAKTLSDLQQYKSVQEIPNLVFGVINSLPKYLPEGSQIRRILVETIAGVKSSLLASFHAKFEAHLQDNRDADTSKKMWSTFLGSSRDWLLSYALVSLLPVLVSDSRSLIVEKYIEALDEAMTPLWGRFHFHLTSARESLSVDQLLWTFSYAKSFVTLLVDLCSQMTSSGQLQRLHSNDYKSASIQHVRDKAVRFMRAHLAQAIVSFSPISKDVCVQLAERSLELDASLVSICPTAPPLPIVAVIYDARAVHSLWVQADQEYFKQFVLKSCAELAHIYVFRVPFCAASTIESAGATDKDMITSRSSVTGRCYNAVYDCLYAFSLACKRYENLPAASQDSFSAAVLEPLLITAVGLFLYRIRSQLALFCISNTILPYSEPLKKNLQTGKYETPQCLVDFSQSVEYFQLSLGYMTDSCRERKASRARYEEYWRSLRRWFPEGTITAGDIERGFVPAKMVDQIMDVASSSVTVESSKQSSGSGSGSGDVSKDFATLGAVADLARAQVITMTNVLETQWRKLAADTKSS